MTAQELTVDGFTFDIQLVEGPFGFFMGEAIDPNTGDLIAEIDGCDTEQEAVTLLEQLVEDHLYT